MPKPPLPENLQALLAKPNPSVMGTLRPDGAPHTVATWYLWEEQRVLVNLDAERTRLDYVRRDPRVSLTVLDEAGWWRHVSLFGRAVSIVDDPELVDIDRLAQHYEGVPYPDRERPRVSVWIEVESWHAWRV
jgi:PPOX class probable F420-dependent enzyme